MLAKIRRVLVGMFHKKTYTKLELRKSHFKRCLTTLDLTALGIGSTLGAGVYVVTGKVAHDAAGPAVVISFFIAALASILAGLSYAEFGSRVPRTGSAYIYSYISIGELMAFIIGWNMILEYIIGTASVARAWSANFDEVSGGHIKVFFNSSMRMNIAWFAPYPDLFAFLITIILTVILSIGVKESSRFNNICTGINLCVILYAIICGFFKVDINNWKIPPRIINNTNGHIIYDEAIGSGNFFPFGFVGMLSGAGTCFYAFVGFDGISSTGEEVINPQKAIPIAIIVCLTICFFAYSSVSAVMTLMWPYYLIDADAPLPFVFGQVGWYISKYIIGIGAIFGLSTSLLGALFPLPRVIYAMSADGLIFKFLCQINQRFQTPLIATVLSGLFAATMAAMFDLKSLVDMMSIGTLLAYTLVAFSILMLRGAKEPIDLDDDDTIKHTVIGSEINIVQYARNILKRRTKYPTTITDFISKLNSYILFGAIFILGLLLSQNAQLKNPILILFVVIFIILIIFLCVTLRVQPENPVEISFKVPFVPWLPAISIFINLYLMLKLPIDTWYRFCIWMVVGFFIYFFYGLCNSEERKKRICREYQHLLKN